MEPLSSSTSVITETIALFQAKISTQWQELKASPVWMVAPWCLTTASKNWTHPPLLLDLALITLRHRLTTRASLRLKAGIPCTFKTGNPMSQSLRFIIKTRMERALLRTVLKMRDKSSSITFSWISEQRLHQTTKASEDAKFLKNKEPPDKLSIRTCRDLRARLEISLRAICSTQGKERPTEMSTRTMPKSRWGTPPRISTSKAPTQTARMRTKRWIRITSKINTGSYKPGRQEES